MMATATLRRRGFRSRARVVRALGAGLAGLIDVMNFRETPIAILLGLLAWATQSLGFLLMLDQFGVSIPGLTAFAIQPAATLVGAASMSPGSVGATETVAVALKLQDVETNFAILAATGMRLATLWFAIVVGFVAIGVILYRRRRRERVETFA